MLLNEKQKKAGVSLVTVLLFMLVATIAATATYKWLTSEGRSSASRMQQNEAYQSALAGIESARSWMTYNANETGAIIKQYKDGNNAPVKLTDRLAAFVRAGQHYDVYLVGVNTENSTYKLKLLSEGTSRNGEAKHSEIAILNVNGLYRVQVPVEQSHASIDFDYAYFGGSYDGAGSLTLSSAIVNGNWEGNPQGVLGTFLVTGYAKLSGNNVNLGPLACVGGDFLPENNGLKAGNLYVGGNVNGNMSLDSSAYFDGNVTNKDGGIFDIKGNVTLNGTMMPLPSLDFKIHGNFCATETGVVRSAAGTDANHKPFKVEGNVWMPGDQNLAYGKVSGSGCRCKHKTVVSYFPYIVKNDTVPCSYNSFGMIDCEHYNITDAAGDNYASYQKILLGEKKESDVYVKTGHPWNDYKTLRETKSFTTTYDQVRNCKSGACNGPDHENWKNETLVPYMDRANKDKLYYVYYMPSGTTDVDYGVYYDNYWNHDVYGFFVDVPTGGKNETTRYTDSYNTFYRYLNYENNNITGSPYCRKPANKSFVPECGVSPWFKVEGHFHNDMPATKPFDCAESVKDRCDALWSRNDSRACDGSSNFVEDPLVTAKEKFEPYASYGCAATITSYNTSLVSTLNDCYEQLFDDENKRKDSLYNDFLVVKVSGGTNSTNPSGKLKGKFIVIMTDSVYTSFMDTEDDSYVFYYMEKGINTLNDATRKNTFIYTEGGIGTGNQFNLTGTIYATAASCSGMGKLQSSSITYDPNLMSVLTAAKVICANDGSVCGGPASGGSDPTSPSGSTSTEYATGGYDNFYISVAPQLSITLESQYKNAESVATADADDVDASFIVLPRIIYLTKDAKGKLEDYYNIVPLNSLNPVTSTSVSCSGGLPVSGKLVPGDTKLTQGDYSCKVVGSVRSKSGVSQQTVPFWVRVRGEGGILPTVSFEESTKELNIGASTPVNLVLPTGSGGAAQTCQVTVTADPDHAEDWSVSAATGVTVEGANRYTVTATSAAPTPVLTVSNVSSAAGSIILYITQTTGCNPGAPEVIFNANTAPIQRKSIADYCVANPSDANCEVGGEYKNLDDRPDCGTSEEWVTANGAACSISETNNRWSCAISAGVSLRKVRDIAGCQAVIAPVSYDPPLEANKTPPYYLYASLKKIPMTFHAGFDVEGTLDGDRKVKIHVEDDNGTTREKNCSYSDFTDTDLRDEKCDVVVYHNSVVTLSLEPENPSDFNYWMCENGSDCPDDEAHTSLTYQITVTSDENVVYAHFGERDKHCFFDEFKEPVRGSGYRHNRDYIECGHETDYCIDICESDGSICANALTTSSYPNAKWRLVSASTATMNDIDYSVVDSRISLKSSATRGRKESDKKHAVIMSSVQAGLYGTMKAQFQPPREGTSAGDVAMATSMNSGFILRSNPSVSSFLKLNVFIASNGVLKARLSLNGEPPWKEEALVRNGSATFSPDRNAIVLMSATISAQDGHDVLKVDVYSSAWTNEPYSATFALTDENISGVTTTATRPNEYVGFSLSDQNFKIYGIGWKSDSYRSDCWDTYPVLSCSFKAAYTGGIVPKGTSVKPWVGLSAWFDAVGKCDSNDVGYYYKGPDACSSTGSTYNSCGSGYTFTETGAHGYFDNDGNEIKTAKAVIENCTVYGEEAAWARNGDGVAANCGSFWVGEQNACSRHYTFESTVTGDEGEYFGLTSGTANFRGATLIVKLDNPDSKPVEVYMFSKNETSGYTYGNSHIYSLPYQSSTGGNNVTLNIPVADLSSAEGFDPEKVVGVFVKTFNEASVNVTSVMSSCPNAVEITGCRANYEGGSWKISAAVKNQVYTDKINVTEEHSYITSPSGLECLKVSNDDATRCKFSGDSAVFSWGDNPYTHVGDTYSFNIVLTSTEATTSECTASGSVTGITATCGDVSGTTAIQGKGIPQFTYSIANCPDNACNFKIDLVKNGSVAATISSSTSSGNVSDAQTATNAANGTSDMLAEGTYKFRLSSTNAARPFTECESEKSFTVSAPGAISASCSFGTVVKGGTATLSMTNIENNEESTTISIERSGADAIEKTLAANDDSQTFSFTAPNSAESYSYSVYYTVNSTKKKICDATLVVVDGLGCSVSPTSITLGESFTFTPTWGGICTSTTLTGDGVGTPTSCATSYSITPTSVGTQTYTYKFTGDVGTNVECPTTPTVTVTPPAPEFSCPANWGGRATASGGSATLTLSPTYCDNSSCTMKITGIDDDFVAFSSPRTLTDASVTTSTNKTYTVAIKNGTGTTSHDCSITYAYDGPTATTCQFDNSTRVYGEKGKFKVDKLKVSSGETWELDDPNGTKVLDGTYSNAYNSSYWETGEIRVKVSGTYTLKLGGLSACTANLTVTQPTAENCRLDAETIPSGNSTKFHWDLKNCKDNQCSYMIKLAGNDFSGQTSVGEQNDRQVDVSTAGEYVVWLNGTATDCKKTLTIAAGGTLSCSIAANIPVDEQWQKIKVTSTRPTGKYDIWIDGSIGKYSNGYNMTGIDINKDATNVEVGGFTCSTSGFHTYKITANNSTTSLCNGSFTCLNVPKVDCYFLYSSNWSAVSGSVVPKTPLQFCASQASFSKRTTLTGTNKDGSFSKTDFDLSKDGRVCYGFDAPSSDNSYTFSVSANGEEACNDTPILEVATPPNPVTLTYGGSLTTLTAGTWSVFSNNANSGVMRCKASGNVSITVNGSSKTVTTDLSSIDGANPRPTVYVTVVVPTGKSIQCHTDW